MDTNTVGLIEKSVRAEARYEIAKGEATTEYLFKVPLDTLNVLANKYNNLLKNSSEIDFLKKRSSSNNLLQLKFDTVLYVIEVRLAEAQARENAKAEKEAKRNRIELLQAQLAKIDESKLGSLTEEQIRAEIAALAG